MTTSSAEPRKRNPALVVVDIIASVLLVFAMIAFGITAIGWGTTFLGVPGTPAAVAGFGLIAVAVLAFALTAGMALVNIIRKRYTFWWPLIGVAVMVAAIYISFAIVGAGTA